MKLSDIINSLQLLLEKYGDLPVYIPDSYSYSAGEYGHIRYEEATSCHYNERPIDYYSMMEIEDSDLFANRYHPAGIIIE